MRVCSQFSFNLISRLQKGARKVGKGHHARNPGHHSTDYKFSQLFAAARFPMYATRASMTSPWQHCGVVLTCIPVRMPEIQSTRLVLCRSQLSRRFVRPARLHQGRLRSARRVGGERPQVYRQVQRSSFALIHDQGAQGRHDGLVQRRRLLTP